MPAEQKAFPAKQETKPLTETPQEADDDTRLSLLRQVNYRIMEQLKQSYPTASFIGRYQQRLYETYQALSL